MILQQDIRLALCVCLSLVATPAFADVLEIDGEQATWVTADPSTIAYSDRASANVEMVPEDLADLPSATTVRQHSSSRVPARYRGKVMELAQRYDLSPALIEALVWQESRWRPDARSAVGAHGLTQLMPGTAREMGVDPTDPFANLEGGARYLRIQLDRFDGNLENALAAYNAGPDRVARTGGVPPFRETRSYIAGIMARLAIYSLTDDDPAAQRRSSN